MPSAARQVARARRAIAAGLPAIDNELEWQCQLCGRVTSRLNRGPDIHIRRGCPVRKARKASRAAGRVHTPELADSDMPGMSSRTPDGSELAFDSDGGSDNDESDSSTERSDSPDVPLIDNPGAYMLTRALISTE